MRHFINSLIFLLLLIVTTMATAATKAAIFAGGCFWCVEADFDKVPGVIKTISGYDGGTKANPNYSEVSSGKTNYAESVKVIYDPAKVTYAELLTYFWHHIDPTVKDKQFCDTGKQYRSAIFYLNSTQKQLALKSLKPVHKKFPRVYTQIVPSTHFYAAAAYHQDYYKKNPIRYQYYRWGCGRDARVKAIWQ